METLDAFLSSYGYWVFFAVGFAEFVGVPIVSVPVLVAGGALVASGTLGFWGVVVSVAAGGLLADLGWYTVGRRQGLRLIDVACGLSSNPMACVSTVRNRLSRLGTPYVLLAKMLPGSGNFIAVAAGLAGFRTLPFILADAVALTLWAAIYTGTGWTFSDQVTPVIEWALMYNRAVVVVLLLIVLVAARRLWQDRFHQRVGVRTFASPVGHKVRSESTRSVAAKPDSDSRPLAISIDSH